MRYSVANKYGYPWVWNGYQSGVLNYALSNLMDLTKGASLIPGIGFVTISTILFFAVFYLLFSECFTIFYYYYVILM